MSTPRLREQWRTASKKWRESHREQNLARIKEWKAANPEKLAVMKRRHHERNENCRIRKTIYGRIYSRLKNDRVRKLNATEELLGCDIQFLKGFLKAKFSKGMSWDNWGEWHIDHVIPCAEFDLRDIGQQKQCFHYTNLQPKWAIDNLRKAAKCPPVHQWGLL